MLSSENVPDSLSECVLVEGKRLAGRGWSAVAGGRGARPQSNQSAGPGRFLIFCSISIFLLASLVAGRRPQCSAGAMQQGLYSSPGRSRVGPAFYVFSFLGPDNTGLERIWTSLGRQKAKHGLLLIIHILWPMYWKIRGQFPASFRLLLTTQQRF